jgi:hypothetical protein
MIASSPDAALANRCLAARRERPRRTALTEGALRAVSFSYAHYHDPTERPLASFANRSRPGLRLLRAALLVAIELGYGDPLQYQ